MIGPLGKLHNIVIYIRSSANRTTWFTNHSKVLISLDNRMRWNSWFLMLQKTLKNQVRTAIQLYIKHYSKDIHEDDILSMMDWIKLCMIYDFLIIFWDVTLTL